MRTNFPITFFKINKLFQSQDLVYLQKSVFFSTSKPHMIKMKKVEYIDKEMFNLNCDLPTKIVLFKEMFYYLGLELPADMGRTSDHAQNQKRLREGKRRREHILATMKSRRHSDGNIRPQ